MPILGIGYLVTMVGPDPTIPWAHNTFQIVRCILLSTQVRKKYLQLILKIFATYLKIFEAYLKNICYLS